MKYTFHCLGIPHTVTSKEFNACAYTMKILKFSKMMKALGHKVIHYGHEDSDLECDEHVSVLTNDDFEKSYGTHDWKSKFFKFETNDYAYQTFYKNAIREVGSRKGKNEFILPFWGSGVRPICDAHPDLICVEPGIGYAGGHWARWKVWESYAIYHAYCGLKNVGQCNQDWYDVVIPNYFDKNDFEFNDKKGDYFLYLGRVYDGKGVNVAIQATEKAGVKLVIAGQKEDGYNLPDHVEYIGYADMEKRKKLMANAAASFLPSMYVEPFGGVQIENLLSGTPTITTDWGSFAENNLHGVTGFRCRTMGDFVEAIHSVDKIKPSDCRKWGENFTLENVAPMYEKYFDDVLNVYNGDGWYSKTLKLKALTKKYPTDKTNNESNNNNTDEKMTWYYFYTPEYEVWHKHLQSRLEPTFNTVPIKLDKIDIHNQHSTHHFTGSTDRMRIVIDVIKQNLGKKIVFSDVTWVINKDGVGELKSIMDNCDETTYAQNSWDSNSVNIGLICINCTVEEVELWSYCLGQIEENRNLHEQSVIDKRLKRKPMFDPQKVRAYWIENAEQFKGYLALKIFTPCDSDHKTRFDFRLNVIKQYNLDF